MTLDNQRIKYVEYVLVAILFVFVNFPKQTEVRISIQNMPNEIKPKQQQ